MTVSLTERMLAVLKAYGGTYDGLWMMDEPSGTTMNDRSGLGHHGSYVGSPTLGVAGVDLASETAMSLPGNVANYGMIADAAWMDRVNSVCVGIWCKTTSATTQNLFNHWETGFLSWGLSLTSSQEIEWHIQNNGSNKIVDSLVNNTYLRDGNWHLVGYEWDATDTNMKLYVDGRWIATNVAVGGNLTTLNTGIGIGRKLNTAGGAYLGSLAGAFICDPMGEVGWLKMYEAGVRKRTRWYLPSSTTQSMTPGYDSLWTSTGSAARRLMVLAKTNTALAGTSISDTTANAVEDVLHRQFIATNNPFTRAGKLEGTFTLSQRPSEGNAAANAFLQVVIKIVKPDGTLRGVAYAGQTVTTASAVADDPAQEFPTGNGSRIMVNIALTSTDYNEGDFLVIEMGARYAGGSAIAYTSAIRAGDPTGTFEQKVTSGDTTDRVPWVEFSQDLPVYPREGWGIAA